ncbi:uncharacterized protein LOC134197071 [Corticium candelabrum]|uniref:uncharacterized protein LOC134197071 n=1 Tax=Corticium candelabrum TaxID=121492 RepID=UPI002E25C684|nr:uncharacterized protein LOC134197071 [Corticium candelabrum]
MSVDEFSVTQCSDEEFDLALKSFSLEEVNVAIRIFEKQIEVEQRIQAGLQNLIKLYKAQPGMATKGTSVNKFMASTKQLVASQGRLAVLRSRSLRCVTRHIELGGHSFMNSGGQADGVHGDVGNNQSAINTGGSSGVSRKMSFLILHAFSDGMGTRLSLFVLATRSSRPLPFWKCIYACSRHLQPPSADICSRFCSQ